MIRMKSDKSTMVFLVVFLLGLLAAREAFSAPLLPLSTNAAKGLLAGTAEPGQSFKVEKLYEFESGERFAQVKAGEKLLWLQIEDKGIREGETYTLSEPAYLFREPVVEENGAAEPAEEQASPLNGKSRHPFVPRALGANTACTNFITAKGEFGAWGAYLMGRLSASEHPYLFNANVADLGKVCPRFSAMNTEERKNFWVWLLASMANYESSCNEKVKAKGVNGTAAGLLQLHLGKEHNYGCRSGINSLRARDNLECGLTILNRDIKRTGKIFPGRNNYWHVLRPQSGPGARTLRMARKYSPCF